MGLLDKFFNSNKPIASSHVSKPKVPRNSNSCPNCGAVFDEVPKRKKQCGECGEVLYVRTTQQLFDSDLLTEEQVRASDFYKELMEYGATLEDYHNARKELATKWGFDPKPYDIVWSVSNKLIARGPNLSGAYDKKHELLFHAKMITFSQAKYQAYRGHDPAPYKKTVNEYDIQLAQRDGSRVKKFEILAQGCCNECDKLNKTVFSVDEIKNKNVLPQQVCTNKLEKDHKYSWCMCMYLPVIPGF